MATTVTVKKLSVAITTILGTQFTAADSDESKAGTLAFTAFNAGETIVIDNGATITEIPFHAIDNIVVTETEGTVDMTDSVCK